MGVGPAVELLQAFDLLRAQEEVEVLGEVGADLGGVEPQLGGRLPHQGVEGGEAVAQAALEVEGEVGDVHLGAHRPDGEDEGQAGQRVPLGREVDDVIPAAVEPQGGIADDEGRVRLAQHAFGIGPLVQVLGIEPPALPHQDADEGGGGPAVLVERHAADVRDRTARHQDHAAHLLQRAHAHVGEHAEVGDALYLDGGDEADVEIPLSEQPRHQGRRVVARREQVRVVALQKTPRQRLAVQEVDDADSQLGQGLPYLDMAPRKSWFVFAFDSLSSSSSMLSTVDSGLSTLRSTQTRCSSLSGISSSSLRVPDLLMSMAGKTRLSTSLRSRWISQLPVPLNSSKMTSSMRLPVSTRAVAMMVSDPPSSMLRAAPKKRFGRCRALASIPPESTLPEGGWTDL